MFDVVSVGHFAIDSIFLPSRSVPFVVLGGSAAYASLAARRLNATVSVVSKVGEDFPKAYMWWLEQEGVDLSGVVRIEHAHTTGFELKYSKDLSKLKMTLKDKAPPILIEDLPKLSKAKAVHISPIAGEVQYDVIEKLKGNADLLSLDPQGLVRNFDQKGNVINGNMKEKRILELVDIYKSSQKEIKAATGLSRLGSAIKAIHNFGVETVIVTLGRKGAVLSVEGTLYKIPSCKSKKIVDPTGAGDVFVAGFLTEYIRGENSLWCACVGSAAASLVIEAAGPTFFGEKTDIFRRARRLYEKEIKQ